MVSRCFTETQDLAPNNQEWKVKTLSRTKLIWGGGGFLLIASWEEKEENGGREVEEKLGIDHASTLTVSIRVEWVSTV